MAVIRVDGASGFKALCNSKTLHDNRITLEMGEVKNTNKNPIAEKAVQGLGAELLKQQCHSSVLAVTLATVTARLNSRIRSRGLSAREMWLQLDQFTNEQLPISDLENILNQHTQRIKNHHYSEQSKMSGNYSLPTSSIVQVRDLVYLKSERDKTRARDRYIVVLIDREWCHIKKFIGSQLRSLSYKVRLSDFTYSPTAYSLAA